MATNTDFQPYLDEVNRTGLTCQNDTEIPRFSYEATYSLQNSTTWYTILNSAADDTLGFNVTLAMVTMFSEFIVEGWGWGWGSPSPTESPTANPTNSPTSSAFAKKPVLWMCAFMSVYHLIISV
jgi:hypothetical protein